MKIKTVFLCAAVAGLFACSACKKDWACQCTTNSIVTTHEIDDETLLNARSKCKSYEGSALGITTTCSLQ